MTYVVKKEQGEYVVRHRYTRASIGQPCATHGEAQSRADRLNRSAERGGRHELRELADREG